jgi:hypothetical protein
MRFEQMPCCGTLVTRCAWAGATFRSATGNLVLLVDTSFVGVDGFVEGLFGAEEAIDLPERAHRGLGTLGQLPALIAGVLDVATDAKRRQASLTLKARSGRCGS